MDTLTNYAAQIQGSGTVCKLFNDARIYTAKEYKAYSENIQSSHPAPGLVEVGQGPLQHRYPDTTQPGSKIFYHRRRHPRQNVDIVGADIAARNQPPSRPATGVSIKAATNTHSLNHTGIQGEVEATRQPQRRAQHHQQRPIQAPQQRSTTHAPSTWQLGPTSPSKRGRHHHRRQPILADKDLSIHAGKNLAILAQTDTHTQKRTNQQPHSAASA